MELGLIKFTTLNGIPLFSNSKEGYLLCDGTRHYKIVFKDYKEEDYGEMVIVYLVDSKCDYEDCSKGKPISKSALPLTALFFLGILKSVPPKTLFIEIGKSGENKRIIGHKKDIGDIKKMKGMAILLDGDKGMFWEEKDDQLHPVFIKNNGGKAEGF